MALGRSSARRYAEAILELGIEQDNLQEWRGELASANDALSPDTLRLLASPSISLEARRRAIRSATDKAAPGMRALLLLLLERDRLVLLPDIARALEALIDAREGIELALITTATALAPTAQREVAGELERTTRRRLRAAFAVDPALIGGAVVRVGDHQVDGSVRTRLAVLRERLAG